MNRRNTDIELKQFDSFRLPLVLFILLVFISYSFAQSQSPIQRISDVNAKACNFVLSTDDWRVLSALGLLLSSVFIAAMYMYGSVIDPSFIARAKDEMYQLLVTGIIISFFALIVSLMCQDVISDLFGKTNPPYIESYNYLNTLATDYIQKTAIKLGALASSLSLLSEIKKGKDIVTTFSFITDPFSYFSDQSFALFGSLMFAYVIVISQINILAIIPYLSLMFFVPIGIILRSIYPFRRFGGGLLGLGIGLYVFVPFVLLFNSLLISPYMNSDQNYNLLYLQCSSASDCYSHICNYSQQVGNKICYSMKDAGEDCDNDFQCKSGICRPTPTGNKCFDCGVEGSLNPLCCPGYIRNQTTGKCQLAKANDEPCLDSKECISGVCEFTDSSAGQTVCVRKKNIGEICTKDEDCLSRSCDPISKKCKQTLATEEDKQTIISFYQLYLTKAPSQYVSSNFEVSVSGATPLVGQISDQEVSKIISSDIVLDQQSKNMGLIYEKIISPIVLVFIAGVLLPLLNITLIVKGVSDLSSALGEEIEIASIWKLI